MHCVGGMLIALGELYMSLQLVVVSLQLFELLLMVSLHLYSAGLDLLENTNICHGCWGRKGS